MLLASAVINTINLSIHPGSKTIESAISAQHEIVMRPHCHLCDFDPVSEYLNRLFCMEVQRVADSHLAILVIAKSKQPIIFSQKQIMELACVDLRNWGVEIKL